MKKPDFFPDGFLYAGCLALVNGSSFYRAVVKGRAGLPEDADFEDLLYVPKRAYELACPGTGEYVDEPEKNRETFSNKEGWAGAP